MASSATCLYSFSAHICLGTCASSQTVPVLTISYEDAPEVILDNLSKKGLFSRRRVSQRLFPIGLRNYKDDVPRRNRSPSIRLSRSDQGTDLTIVGS